MPSNNNLTGIVLMFKHKGVSLGFGISVVKTGDSTFEIPEGENEFVISGIGGMGRALEECLTEAKLADKAEWSP